MSEVIDFIKRVIDKSQLNRELFSDRKTPSRFDDIRIIPFFGDVASEFIFSTMLGHRIFKHDYLIMCSWPGHSQIFEGVDEYWSPKDVASLGDLHRHANGFLNSKSNIYERMLLRYFDRVTTPDEFVNDYYHQGFTSRYFKEFDDIEYILPAIPSANLSWHYKEHTGNLFIFLSPTKYIHRWVQGSSQKMLVEESFWIELISKLISKGFTPCLMQNYGTYDMSIEFNQKCMYITDQNIMANLALMRACDCVLDVFNGISRMALIARAPYFVCDERQRYFNTRDYILDDLCGKDLPHDCMYSFAPIASGKTTYRLVDAIVNRLMEWLPKLDKNDLPSTGRLVRRLSYDSVGRKEPQRIGVRFISVPKLNEEC